MFEYQTAISELTGLPVSNASRLRGPERASPPPATWRSCTTKRTRFLVSARRAPARRETLATTAAGWGTTIEEIPLADGVTDARRSRSDRRRRLRRRSCSTRTSSAPSRTSQALADAAHAAGALMIVLCRPADARRAQAARRVRRRRRRGGGADARQPARLRRPVVRLLRRPGGVPAPHARPHRRRDDRRRRPPRLRAHAADARAAHPPREGDPQHLHRAGAQRARRRRST